MTVLASAAPAPSHRPVQFLGSKLRVLDAVDDAVAAGGPPGVVWEPFAGSTVVSQRLAQRGHRVLAGDALTSSVTFATALLGVGRTDRTAEDAAVQAVLLLAGSLPLDDAWQPWLAAEATALRENDGRALLRVGRELPQHWRSGPADTRDGGGAPALLSDTYAGTYFGLDQALRLERLRKAVDLASYEAGFTDWCRAVALTALCTAASRAVFSAGKHFAQPHHVPETKDLGFHARRVLADRAVDVEEVFSRALSDVVGAARPGSEGHHAAVAQAEEAATPDLVARGITAVYADPPYTAQQYSRYYHLLETLVVGVPPELQLVGGRVTKGLYPTGRFLSPFCSRRAAPGAFARLVGQTAEAGARLVLSYSSTTSASGKTGNARTVGLDALVGLVEDAYGPGRADVRRLGVRYRQFNRLSNETPDRDDPEYLIVAERHAR